MTPLQKRCQELLPVIQAGAEGKELQILVCEDWNDMQRFVPMNFLERNQYRIKPEPRYRPFTPEEALKQSSRCVVPFSDNDSVSYPFAVDSMGVWVRTVTRPDVITFENFLRGYRFKHGDSTVCGVLLTD